MINRHSPNKINRLIPPAHNWHEASPPSKSEFSQIFQYAIEFPRCALHNCRLTLSLVSTYGVGVIYMRNEFAALSLAATGVLITASSNAFASCTVTPTASSVISTDTTVNCSGPPPVITELPHSVSLTNNSSLTFNASRDVSYQGAFSVPFNNYSSLNFNMGAGNTFYLNNMDALTNYRGIISVNSGILYNRAGGINVRYIDIAPATLANMANVACFGCNGYDNASINAPASVTKPTDMTLWQVVGGKATKVTDFTINPGSSYTIQENQIPYQLGTATYVVEQGKTYKDYNTINPNDLGLILTHTAPVTSYTFTTISVAQLSALLQSLPPNPNDYHPSGLYGVMDTKANIIAADTPGGYLTRLINYNPNNPYAVIANMYFIDLVPNSDGLIDTMPFSGAAGDLLWPSGTAVGKLLLSGNYSPQSGETVQATGNVLIPRVPRGAKVIANGDNGTTPEIGSIESGGSLEVIAGKAKLSSVDGGTVSVESGTTLTGVNSAAIAVNSGTASINGTADGQMIVGNTGTLKGSGTVTGQTTIGAGGTLSPGNSPGILNFTSSVTQSSGSTMNIDIDGPIAGNGGGFYSRLSITGAASTYTIAPNATLTPTLRGITQASISEGVTNTYTPLMGSKFVIVQAAGGVSGTFGTLVQPASGLNAGYRFVDTYPANAVNLYVVPNSYASIGASKSVNAGRVASVIDGIRQPTADSATALGSFYSLPDNASVANALQQLSGYSQTSIINAAIKGQQAITQTIEERMASLRRDGGLSGSDMSTVLFSDAPISQTGGAVNTIMRNANITDASTPKMSDGRTWMMPIYQFSRGAADTNSSGIKTKTIGAVAGSDFTLDGGATFGGALSYVENSLGSGDKATNYGISVYGLRKLGAFYAAGSIVATYDTFQLNRGIAFSDLSRTANSKVAGYQVNAGGEIGYQRAFGELSASPFIGVNIKSINRNSFTESGANALDLSLNAYNKFNFNSKAGVRFSYKLDVSEYAVMPFTEFAWLHDFADPTINLGSNIFATPYTIQGTSYGRDAALVSAGLTISKTDNLKFLAKYAGEFRTKENSSRFNVGLVGKW